MKKNLLAILTASMVISVVGTAFAAEETSNDIKFDGSFSIKYRDQEKLNVAAGTPEKIRTSWKSTLTLNMNAPLANNLDFYTTFNYQNVNTKAGGGTFSADYFNSNAHTNTGITAFGFKYNNAGYSYVVGSQAMTLGGGLAYDNGYIGKNALPYALNVSKKVGATDLNLIVAETNYQSGIDNDKFYAIQGSYAVTPKTDLGAMFAHVSYGTSTRAAMTNMVDSSVNFYSLYASHKLSNKATLSGEYIKASSSSKNQGFQTNLSYKLDEKNTLGAGYYRVEDQASIYDYNGGGMTTSPNNNTEGYIISWKHKFDKNISFTVADFNYKAIDKTSFTQGGGGPTDRNRFFTNVAVSF